MFGPFGKLPAEMHTFHCEKGHTVEVPVGGFMMKSNDGTSFVFCDHCFGDWLQSKFPLHRGASA